MRPAREPRPLAWSWAALLALYSDLHANIQDRFNEAGVEIMSPHFAALRDGNTAAMPDAPAGPRPGSGTFRISTGE